MTGRHGLRESAKHPLRRRLIELVRRFPGVRLAKLWRVVDTNRGTVKYHLIVLERARAVEAVRTKGLTRYFPVSLRPEDRAAFALLWRGRVLEVAREIIANPGISQAELTRLLGMTRKVFRRYANLLIERGLLGEEKRPHLRRYFSTPRLDHLVRRLDHGLDLGKREMGHDLLGANR